MPNDTQHGAFAVKEFESLTTETLKNKSVVVTTMEVFVRCCMPVQGKEQLLQTCNNYFETVHSKSVGDGLGAISNVLV